jgi:hypothetical protein
MLRLVKVLGGVLIFGRVAAGCVSADEAHSQVNPRVACLHAVFANMFVSFSDLDLVQVSAFFGHQFLLKSGIAPATPLPCLRHELVLAILQLL